MGSTAHMIASQLELPVDKNLVGPGEYASKTKQTDTHTHSLSHSHTHTQNISHEKGHIEAFTIIPHSL